MAFLKNLARMLGSPKAEPALHLAAFGKHPGWNDHIDDLGLETENLIAVKRSLYVQGINQLIDAGAWEKLDPAQRIDDFRHNFLWHMPDNDHSLLVAGRLWSSVDGKGRAKYPMVLCAQVQDLPDSYAAGSILRFLNKTQEDCIYAKTADDVRKTIIAGNATLQSKLASPPPPAPFDPADIARLAACPDFAPAREGFHRIVYALSRTMSAYRLGAPHNPGARPEKIRVPLCGLTTPDALLFWLRFAHTLLDPAHPLLLLAPDPAITRTEFFPDSTGWVDILVGVPTPAEFFCLKASPKSVPLTSDIPYTLDKSFTNAVDHFINDCKPLPPGSPLPPWPAF